MAEEKDVVVLVEQPGEAAGGKSPDGSDHTTALASLKSKLYGTEERHTPPSSSRTSKPQCPRVPEKLLQRTNDDPGYKAPKLISLGPYHHQKGETIKHNLAKVYLHQFWMDVDEVYSVISSSVGDLKACYDQERVAKLKDGQFTEMMVVDGCALLSYVICVRLRLNLENYDIRYQDLSHVHQDALLLENQLPYRLLELLMEMANPDKPCFWAEIFQAFFGTGDKSFFQELFGIKHRSFLGKMKKYCCDLSLAIIPRISKGRLQKPKPRESSKPRHDHLLDLYRKSFLGDGRFHPKRSAKGNSERGIDIKTMSVDHVNEQVMASFRNAKELMAAGIRIKPSRTRYLRDISFTSYGITASLRLPPLSIDKSSRTLFLNLIAYEMSADVPSDFISYLRFLDCLIDHADDIKELQSAGVLQNNLGTQEEVAEFFNTLSANLQPNFHAYKDVRIKIREHLNSHYNCKLKMWMTQCLDTYFGSPWTIIAWVGAVFALFLTAVQTYYSAFPH